MSELKNEAGKRASETAVSITVTDRGPYLVFGRPPLAMQFIVPDAEGESWYFRRGAVFPTDREPTALCRCGRSADKPYCDGTHLRTDWDPAVTSPQERMSAHATVTAGERITLHDNEKYCVFARFCHPGGGVWSLTEKDAQPGNRKLAVREASLCPSARLTAWDNRTGRPYEFRFEPSLGLIEDPALGVSGGLWVRGGIEIRREDGSAFEVRNRAVLCRCGRSANKPYCDGSHVSAGWRDGLKGEPDGETLPRSEAETVPDAG